MRPMRAHRRRSPTPPPMRSLRLSRFVPWLTRPILAAGPCVIRFRRDLPAVVDEFKGVAPVGFDAVVDLVRRSVHLIDEAVGVRLGESEACDLRPAQRPS